MSRPLIHDPRVCRVGKLPPRHDARTLKLAKYVTLSRLPPIPAMKTWGSKIADWPMFANDQYGDCTIAGAAHKIQLWTSESTGTPALITDDQVLAAYSAITGFDPNDPSTDQGAVLLDVLKAWRKTGIADHQIGAFVSINPRNQRLVDAGDYLFGGNYLGLALPVAAQSQEVWDVPVGQPLTGDWEPGSWGGHCVNTASYGPMGRTVITWGAKKNVTRRFLNAYCDESWAVLSNDWMRGARSVSGFDVASLQRDLALLAAA